MKIKKKLIVKKMLFIKANNLSGAFLWSIDLDDFNGDYCNQGKFPLLNTIKTELSVVDIRGREKNIALKSDSITCVYSKANTSQIISLFILAKLLEILCF
jgi:hypothetical protein